MAGKVVLSVKNMQVILRREQTAVPIVKGLSFEVHEGEVFGLIGSSGSGKSITCLALLDLLPMNLQRTQGEIRLNGTLLEAIGAQELRKLRGRGAAMILQNPMSCFDSVFTIWQHFAETMASHGFADVDGGLQRARAALAEVGFANPRQVMELYPFQMSGGMLQRVMIALAVSLESPCLIADEPTTDLDVISQSRILDLLDVLRTKRRMGIVLVTHDLGVIARLSDTVAVMSDGRIVETGTVGHVFSKPAELYTQMLLDAHFKLYKRFSYLRSLVQMQSRPAAQEVGDASFGVKRN